MKTPLLLLAAVLTAVCVSAADSTVARLPDPVSKKVEFESDIKPLLEASCVHCHGAVRPKSRYRVDSREALLRGGASGEVAVVPGRSENSPIIRYVSGLVEEMEMPPLADRDTYPPFKPEQIALLRAWIDQGAPWPAGVAIVPPAKAIAGQRDRAVRQTETEGDALLAVIREGNKKAIRRALKDHALVHARDEGGNTPLMHAAFYSDVAMLNLLFERGADVNATNRAGATALMRAVSDVEKVRALLKRGARVDAASAAGNTALLIASHQHGSSAVLRELLAHGANVHARSHRGMTAVYAAAQAGDADAIRTLLDHRADVNSTGPLPTHAAPTTALMAAAVFGHLDCVKLLIENGADVNATSEYGTALHFAAFTDRREVTRLILDRTASVNAPGRRLESFRNDTGLTPLMHAAMTERNDPTIVQWLLERGADFRARASSGETALAIAQRRGNTKVVAALKAAGAVCDEQEDKEALGAPMWSREQTKSPDARLVRGAAAKGLDVLLKSGSRFTEATANRCSTCHQQSQPALALRLARDRHVEYDHGLAAKELRATLHAAAARKDIAMEEPLPVPGIAAWMLIGLHASGHHADGLTDAYVYSLARSQYSDGRWISRASRAPTDCTDVTSTALGIRALKLYSPPALKIEYQRRIDLAAKWLRKYNSVTTEERVFQLLGLSWAGYPAARLSTFTEALLKEQRIDGGWAQLETLETDAYATGIALYALMEAGGLRPSDPAYCAGREFLLQNQLSDGSWFVRTRASPVQVAIDDIFPHGKHQWISSIATTWSTAALMVGLDRNAK